MSVKVKPGVQFSVLSPAGFLILQSLKLASEKLAVDLTITSGTDGMHSGPSDPHHFGDAYDVRSHDFANDQKQGVLSEIMDELGPTAFFGFIEAAGTDNEHFHIQRKKGTAFGIMDYLRF